MALFQPTNITPSSFSGLAAGTVDVTQNLTVSWQVNGNSPLLAYEIVFMQNDTDSTVVLDTGKITLDAPFYGVNYKGEVQYFSTVITASQMFAAGMTNGYANGYKMAITQWWSANDSITQTSASYFITRSVPTISMGEIPNPMPYRAYTFTADYTQAQGDTVEWMQWQVLLADGSNDVVYDTGKIYGTGEIKMDYDGFITGTSYKVQCTVQTENGIEISTGWTTFPVEYASSLLDGTANACALCDTDAVEITLPSSVYITGKATGTVAYERNVMGQNTLVLVSPSDAVVWNEANTEPLSLPYPYTIVISGSVSSVITANTLLTISSNNHSMSVIATNDGFHFQKDGNDLFHYPVTLYGGENYRMVIAPQRIDMELWNYTGVPTYPSPTLYPDVDLYPSNGVKSGTNFSAYIDEWQSGEVQSISVNGPNKYEFIWVYGGELTEDEIAQIISDDSYEPSYDSETEFLALFDNTLSAGSLSSSEEIEGFAIYRKANNESYFRHLVDLPIGSKTFRDYGAASQNTYQYYVYASTESYYAASSIATEPVTPLFWNYTLLCCTKDDNGVYHVQNEYRFALDVASGNMGNNNNPSLQQNFTRYPIRQPVNSNYRSGTLTALIGKVEDGKYVDSTSLMQELYELSTSTLTKFLKTRKGEIFMVETSSPVQMQTGDTYVSQPVKISLPWVEVGDASNASIVQTEEVLQLPEFSIDLATMNVIMNYPRLSDPGSFSIQDADFYVDDPGAFETSDYTLDSGKDLILNIPNGSASSN